MNPDRCMARLWNDGWGAQCTGKHLGDTCYCKNHQPGAHTKVIFTHIKVTDSGEETVQGLGDVVEGEPIWANRPEKISHKNGKPHVWKLSDSGEEVVKERKTPTKKKKEPKAEKKAPVEDDGAGVGLIEEKVVKGPKKQSAAELRKLLAAAEEEEDVEVSTEEDTDNEPITKVIDGVEYTYNPETKRIIDPNDMVELGDWNEGDNEVDWDGEDEANKHAANVKELE